MLVVSANQLLGRDAGVKSVRDQMEIVNAYALVGSYRGAAALCGTTHKTVKRVLERRARGQACRRSRPAPETNTAVVAQLIQERVRQTDGRIGAKRLLPVAEAAGYTGSLRNLQRAVKAAREAWKAQRRSYRRGDFYGAPNGDVHPAPTGDFHLALDSLALRGSPPVCSKARRDGLHGYLGVFRSWGIHQSGRPGHAMGSDQCERHDRRSPR